MHNLYETNKLLEEKEKEIQALKLKYKKLERKYTILNSICYKFKKENQLYIRFPSIKIYNYLRKVKKHVKKKYKNSKLCGKVYELKQTIKLKLNYHKLPTIDVVVPTYRKNEYIKDTINSILAQKYPMKKIKIIISVNGGDETYYKYLKKYYKNKQNVKVIFTNKRGPSTARNNTKKYLKSDFVTYLDDDDLYTESFLLDLAKNVKNDTTILCGKICNMDEKNNIYNEDTYINRVIAQNSDEYTNEYYKIGSLFSSFNAKLYKRELIQNYFEDFDEDIFNAEDVLFWVENICKLYGKIYVISKKSAESYIRRLTENSLSRPNIKEEYKFYIDERLTLVNLF